jgi:hypothetical protein
MGGKLVGFANSATCTDDYSLEAIHILGQLQAIDYVPQRASHRIELDMMVLRGDSLEKNNLVPTGAGNFGYLSPASTLTTEIVGSINSMPRDLSAVGDAGSLRVLHGMSIDIDILAPDVPGLASGTAGNTNTNNAITYATVPYVVRYKSCFYDGGNLRFEANRVIGRRCTFYALDRKGWGMATPWND